MGGDVNTLQNEDIVDHTGLSLIVDQPSRGKSKLDRIFVSDPLSYDNIKVIKSSVRSDHEAIIVYNGVN